MSTVVETTPQPTPTPVVEATPQPTPTPVTNWYDGADAEIIGHMQNLGWDKKTPAEAALLAAKSHREANKLIGVPADQILRKPKDAADLDNWNKVYDFLGVPKEATGYDMTNVKRADGKDVEPAFVDALRKAAHSAKLPPGAAVDMARAVVAHIDAEAATKLNNERALVEEQRRKLKDNWGPNYAANEFIAKEAVKKFGLGEEVVVAIATAAGLDKTMEFFRALGVATGEDRFVAGGGGGGQQVWTKEAATARLADLRRDPEWVKRWASGGAAEKQEKARLDTIIAGTDN